MLKNESYQKQKSVNVKEYFVIKEVLIMMVFLLMALLEGLASIVYVCVHNYVMFVITAVGMVSWSILFYRQIESVRVGIYWLKLLRNR